MFAVTNARGVAPALKMCTRAFARTARAYLSCGRLAKLAGDAEGQMKCVDRCEFGRGVLGADSNGSTGVSLLSIVSVTPASRAR